MSSSDTTRLPSEEKKDDLFWYFAIGSMMNPVALQSRNVVPRESHPGVLLDHKLDFFGPMGVACAVNSEGTSFHGVLHHVDNSTMESLDRVELNYLRKAAKAQFYNGDLVDATVYIRDPNVEEGGPDQPPSERYLEIMTKGAQHFGVKQQHIDFLTSHVKIPRTSPDAFCSFSLPVGATSMAIEEVLKGDGKDAPIRFTVNSKVLEIRASADSRECVDSLRLRTGYGVHLELLLSRLLYDPKYGMPNHLSDFTREHSAYIEDLYYQYWDKCNKLGSITCVARFEQEYTD